MTDHDEELREGMRALREHDLTATPSFARVRDGASRRVEAGRRRRRALAWTGAVAIAAAVLLVWLGRSDPRLGPAPSFAGTEPLAFLLAPPSESVVSGDPHLEGSW